MRGGGGLEVWPRRGATNAPARTPVVASVLRQRHNAAVISRRRSDSQPDAVGGPLGRAGLKDRRELQHGPQKVEAVQEAVDVALL
jgi:hypothetical protein